MTRINAKATPINDNDYNCGLKQELAWVIDKRLRVISNKMLFKTVVPLRN